MLRDYFNGKCPLCRNNILWNAEDSGHLYPELCGIDDADQACPVCLGYETAREDLEMMQGLEEMKHDIGWGRNPGRLSKNKFEALKKDFLDLVSERYTLQNRRRREMRLELWDVTERVDRFREVFIDGATISHSGYSSETSFGTDTE